MTYFDCEFICLFGRQIPSTASMQAVTASMDADSIKLFLKHQKKWVDYTTNILFLSYHPIVATSEYEKCLISIAHDETLLEQRCIRAWMTDSQIKLYMQSRLITDWHYILRGNLTGVDAQKYRKHGSAIMTALESTDPEELEKKLRKVESKSRQIEKNFFKCHDLKSYLLATEFAVAFDYVACWDSTMSLMEESDKPLQWRLNRLSQLAKKQKELFEWHEEIGRQQNESGDRPYLFQCPFCSKVSNKQRGETPSHCGSCGKKYGSTNKATNRASIEPIAKEWDSAPDGGKKYCQDCGKRRLVRGGACKECFKERCK
jgi:hypothetical protein